MNSFDATTPDELKAVLARLLRSGSSDKEILSLLSDMADLGALEHHTEMIGDVPNAIWRAGAAAVDGAFADRIFPMEDDDSALKAELFLNRDIVFSVGLAPTPHLWWHPAARPWF